MVNHSLPTPRHFSIGERLEKGIKNAILLQADEAVVVTAQEEFNEILPSGEGVRM